MKATIKNQIKLAIVAVCVLFIGSSVVVAEETLLLASLSHTTPLEELEDFDRFPGYHKEARNVENKKEIKVECEKAFVRGFRNGVTFSLFSFQGNTGMSDLYKKQMNTGSRSYFRAVEGRQLDLFGTNGGK